MLGSGQQSTLSYRSHCLLLCVSIGTIILIIVSILVSHQEHIAISLPFFFRLDNAYCGSSTAVRTPKLSSFSNESATESETETESELALPIPQYTSTQNITNTTTVAFVMPLNDTAIVDDSYCPHTLTYSLTATTIGLGSQLNFILNNAAWASLHGRTFFMIAPDIWHEWNYINYELYFRSVPAIGYSCALSNLERTTFTAEELNDNYPMWSEYELPHPEVLFGEDIDFPSRDSSMPKCKLCLPPTYQMYESILDEKMDFTSSISENGTLQPPSLKHHYYYAHNTKYMHPFQHYLKLNNDPVIITKNNVRNPQELHDLYNLPKPIFPPNVFLWRRRWMHRLMKISPNIQSFTRTLLSQWKLRPKTHPLERIAELQTKYNFQDLPSRKDIQRMKESELYSRFIAVHIRRGDKISSHEMKVIRLVDYINKIEETIAKDNRLTSSWPLYSSILEKSTVRHLSIACKLQLAESASVLSSNKSANSNSTRSFEEWRQPQILLASDDPLTLYYVQKLRPCWNWLTVDQIPPLQDFIPSGIRENITSRVLSSSLHTSALSTSMIQRELYKALVSDPSIEDAASKNFMNNWMQFHAHLNESQWIVLPVQERIRQSQSLLVECMFLSIADHSIVTYSSNIGRLIALSRGWRDVVSKSIESMDNQSWFWG
jgi:hypothetical protein